jgi:hypothetical protein
MTTKNSQLLELLQSAHEAEQIYLASLTRSERQRVGQSNLWSPKDILAHIAEWKAIMVNRLKAYLQDQDGPTYPDTDAKNAEIFKDHRARSWTEVTAMLERSHAALLTEVQAVSDNQLLAPARFAWQGGEPLLMRIPFNAYVHPLFHIAQLYAERGDRLSGDGLVETMTRGMFTLDEAPRWQARWTYTRACYYAIVQDKSKALADLRQVFAVRPDLIARSQEDTSLQSLWNDPEYRALVGK